MANGFSAAILCGGESSRMGSAKALLPWQGRPLILSMAERLLPHFDVWVSAAPGQELPELPAGVLLVEDPQPHLGPLAGLASVLGAIASRHGPERVAAVTPVDHALMRPEFLEFLCNECPRDGAAVTVFKTFMNPLVAAYRVGLHEKAAELLAKGETAPKSLVRRVVTRELLPGSWSHIDPASESLRSANTPEEWAALAEGLC